MWEAAVGLNCPIGLSGLPVCQPTYVTEFNIKGSKFKGKMSGMSNQIREKWVGGQRKYERNQGFSPQWQQEGSSKCTSMLSSMTVKTASPKNEVSTQEGKLGTENGWEQGGPEGGRQVPERKIIDTNKILRLLLKITQTGVGKSNLRICKHRPSSWSIFLEEQL